MLEYALIYSRPDKRIFASLPEDIMLKAIEEAGFAAAEAKRIVSALKARLDFYARNS